MWFVVLSAFVVVVVLLGLWVCSIGLGRAWFGVVLCEVLFLLGVCCDVGDVGGVMLGCLSCAAESLCDLPTRVVLVVLVALHRTKLWRTLPG